VPRGGCAERIDYTTLYLGGLYVDTEQRAECESLKLAAAARRAQVVEYRREGKTYAEIGDLMGFSYQRAQTLFRQAVAAVVSPAVEAMRAEHLAELAEARAAALRVMRTEHVTVSQGRIIRDAKGNTLIDDGPTLDAARTLAMLHGREYSLTGEEAPKRVEASGVLEHVTPADIELRGLLQQQQARNAATLASLREQA
jgi:hypothetical protein